MSRWKRYEAWAKRLLRGMKSATKSTGAFDLQSEGGKGGVTGGAGSGGKGTGFAR